MTFLPLTPVPAVFLFDLSNYQITSKRGKVVAGKYKWHYFSVNDSKIGLALSSPLLIVMVT